MAETLDSREFVLRSDPSGMFSLAEAFPQQCRDAYALAETVQLPKTDRTYSNIVVCGMGGSAAGGDLLGALLDEGGSVPLRVCRDYGVPNWVGEDTLVFACSYSGNTEETLSAVRHCLSRGCDVLCITSGGSLAELAQELSLPLVSVPGGQPPRTALGYLFVPIVSLSARMGLLPDPNWEELFTALDGCLKDWGMESPARSNPAKRLAIRLYGKIPLLYGLGAWQGLIASRWKSQLNENAKCMAFANAFPELNHNEIVGWTLAETQATDRWAVVILEDGQESPRMQARARITRDLVRGKAETFTVTARGDGLLVKMLSLAYLADFVSLYLAALYGVDPYEIAAIDILKKSLAELD